MSEQNSEIREEIEKMIFANSPFEILNEAFQNLYPDKTYRACIEDGMEDEVEKKYLDTPSLQKIKIL